MFYFKLAMTNIGKNRKSYLPYLLTCALTIMMFYTMDAICKNQGIREMPGGASVQIILNLASWITGIFAAIFLFYTNSFLIRQRKKELGVYQVLGMDKRNLTVMLLCEMLATAVISIASGLLLGILLGKLMFLILLKLIHFSVPLYFRIEVFSIGRTGVLFGAIFAVTLLYNLLQLRKSSPIDLLHGEQTGEREPKTKWFLAVIGAVTLIVGYGIALAAEEPLKAIGNFFVAVVLVIIGTYALFTAGSIALLKGLKRNKNFFYQPGHFATVSGMLYRMKQNAVGLANICIMSTVVIVMISISVSLYTGMQDILSTRFPTDFHVQLSNPNAENVTQLQEIVEEELTAAGVQAEDREEIVSLELTGIQDANGIVLQSVKNYSADRLRILRVTTLETYNRLEHADETLDEGEVLVYSPQQPLTEDTILLGDSTFQVKRHLDSYALERYDDSATLRTTHLVVADMAVMQDLAARYSFDGENTICYHLYFNPEGDADAVTAALGRIYERAAEMDGTYIMWREASEDDFYSLYGGFLFIGIFVGVLFLMGTVLMIYYKQISEGYEDRERFQIMKKVGMSSREVKGTIRSQVLTVFFLPLGAAVLHVAVAFKVMTKLMAALNLTNVKLEALCTGGTVAIFTAFYVLVFLITSREYYKIVYVHTDKK